MRNLIVALMIVMACCYPAPAPTIESKFECNNINTKTTYYTYLKEPNLSESGYTRGMKTGSVNYFEGGTIDFSDQITYYDGQIDAEHKVGKEHNSTLKHWIDVDFKGDKGLSEFYAKGFYPSNRALSAFKKVWFTYNESNLARGPYPVVEYYPSNNITVTGRAHMGPISVTGKPDYYFDYTAKVDNGFLETWDASGWTNKTGARRVDWEKTSQMMGEKIDVTNHLEVKSLFAPGAGGGEDWLPCCGNTMAYVNKSMYDGEDWPNKNQRSIFDCSCPAGPSTEIDPMNPAEEAAPSGKFLTGQFSGPRISVTSSVDEPESGNKSTYTITVQNTGVKDLKDIWLNASIPNDFGYTAVPNPKTAVGQKIIWGFDDLKAGQYQTVTLNVQSTESALTADDLKETTVYAEANYGGSMVTDGPKESNVIYHGYD